MKFRLTKPPTMKDMEKKLIKDALSFTHGHVMEAARTIGISKACIYMKMREYQINVETYRAPVILSIGVSSV